MHAKKTAFIVEHDFIMAAYLADRVIVYEGTPSKEAYARQPQSLLTGKCSAVLPLHFRMGFHWNYIKNTFLFVYVCGVLILLLGCNCMSQRRK